MKICVFSMGWNLKHNLGLGILCSIIHLWLHNLSVTYSNLSDNILYLVTFTYKLEKHKMAAKM